MRLHHPRRLAVLMFAWVWLPAALAVAQSVNAPPATSAALLDGSTLNDIWLHINAKDWEDIHTNYRDGTYYPIDFEWRGVRVRNAGVRTRGRTSRNDHKPSFRVDFNRYVTGQHFLGMKALVLNSLWMDPSMLRDRLSMLVFRRMGIPAPRESHARVYVGANREFAGVYAVVEEVNTSFLDANFGESDGYLYEYHTQEAYGFQDPGPNLDWYRPRFGPQTHEFASAADLYTPIRRLVEAINDAPAVNLEGALGDHLSVSAFIAEMAVQNFVAQADGLLGDFGMNNFYLYRIEGKPFQVIPWDQDGAFRSLTVPPWHNMDTNVLAAKIWDEPRYRDMYLRKLLEVADLVSACPAPVSEPPCGWLEQEVVREYEQIREAVYADPLAPYPTDEFERDIAFIQQFARDRATVVRQFVAQVAPGLLTAEEPSRPSAGR